MGARPATKLESILGIEGARACLQEIEDRIHLEDTPQFRAHLIKEILGRHISNRDLSLTELIPFFPKMRKEYQRDLIGRLISDTFQEVITDYLTEADKEEG